MIITILSFIRIGREVVGSKLYSYEKVASNLLSHSNVLG